MEVVNTIGRRKSAVARIYIVEGKGNITVNNRDFTKFFPTKQLHNRIMEPLVLVESTNKYDIKANLKGGGVNGQAEALRLAIARALVKIDPEHRPALRSNGYLTRDPRHVERKKPGQPGARKKFQFSKR
ncbi:MAG: 30S ribosomal protein S9 [Bacteroidetes bacterium]|nr:30S ribosomal protein S9 [Bacteroidota bacterium]